MRKADPAMLGLALIAATLLAGCAGRAPSGGPPKLEALWSTIGLANPESVVPDATGRFLYVSNVNGEGDARDGNGFIARVALDGRLLQREWATGLDAPKGLALVGNRLFVSDVTVLAEIDATTGRLVARHDAPGAGFLNDVVATPGAGILVSDSARSRIYAWRDGRMDVWLEHELLQSANGLLAQTDRLLVTTMRGRLLAVDWNTREIRTLAQGLADADGIAALDDGSFLVSEWPGRLFHVRADGTSSTLLDTRQEKRYWNDFLLRGDLLLVPNWEPGTLSAYRISQ
ncbi:ATP-binding protein [Lysobacter psychrotolerans]|uniref:ATP-binding protein n=2 Tax=Montanilutibacter psychrotolerans TaxID=1327343 RepID=A0A3M8SN57_9GAMM|nr:ATP-binding protein [Lysobacter psychrotolerans]